MLIKVLKVYPAITYSSHGTRRSFSNIPDAVKTYKKMGFIGLGHMGSKMVNNFDSNAISSSLLKDGILIFDRDTKAIERTTILCNNSRKVHSAESLSEIANNCDIIFSMLPNDSVVEEITSQLIKSSINNKFIHISCSTISPTTSRRLKTLHELEGHQLISSPVFARPDGIAKKQATWLVSGNQDGRHVASQFLSLVGNVVDMGDDVGAANVVKLCGNFLIASSIESIGEAMALAEKHNVDRNKVMDILSNSIFDCLIYKGYGNRVAKRDHRPGGFSLALGLKDVSLVSQAAREVDVPMPFLSTLLDRYVSAKAKGRADFDWSAIGLSVAEDAGIDVSSDVQKNKKDVEEGNLY